LSHFNFFTALVLAVLYALARVQPTEENYLWLLPFLIPGVLIVNLLLLLWSLVRRKLSGVYYLVALGIGSPYLASTFPWKSFVHRPSPSIQSFSVLNYNVSLTGFPYVQDWAFYAPPPLAFQLKDWILQQNADVQCYQEFMTFDGDKNFDMLRYFKEKGYHYYFSADIKQPHYPVVGVLIVTKFPILKTGDVAVSENGFNRIAFADVLAGKDTVRIIGVHLQSMGLKQYDPSKAWDLPSAFAKVGLILNQLKTGMQDRRVQIEKLSAFIQRSPHPVICVGDFNDLPYSYSYQALKKNLDNTFEEAGSGFGFTYNGNTLRTLRIDNQFHAHRIQALQFKTLNTVGYTDHFPLLGTYNIIQRP
jgi:endonuclease/exonuclease/phosphatase (EEP) superfamily protein YafD